jgi:serine-type D-Ala-D-Ala carboxypeptidase (penicillin-binding protein 5/6)
MVCSNFSNPHGLSNTNNYSTVQDLAKLCTYAMRNTQFRKIVQTRKHAYFLPNQSEKQDTETMASQQALEEDKENIPTTSNLSLVLPKPSALFWENTNKMLGEGWSGIKTGITPNAGPCLAASLCRSL